MLSLGILLMLGALFLTVTATSLFIDRREEVLGILVLIFAVAAAALSGFSFYKAGVGKLGTTSNIEDGIIYKVAGKIDFSEESTVIILEEFDGDLLCVKVSEPFPEDARYIRKKNEKNGKTILVSPDNEVISEERKQGFQ